MSKPEITPTTIRSYKDKEASPRLVVLTVLCDPIFILRCWKVEYSTPLSDIHTTTYLQQA